MMKVVSLFSGIGGFDLGFERAGMQVIGVCEIDKHAQTVLQRRFPDATLHTDVRSVHYDRGTVDLICGGFPCQDISVAGKRAGLAGNRSGLWYEFARIIDETEPSWVVIENVPGLFSSAGGRDFTTIIQWLANRGYGVGWRVLDAQGFGLAQRRKRVFIVASFGSPRGCTVLLEPESLQRDYQPRRKTGQDNTGTVAKCLTSHGQRGDWETENMIPAVYAIDSQGSNSWKSPNPHSGIHEENIARCLDTNGTNPTANQGGNVIVPYAIQGNIIDRKTGGANDLGISQENIMYTLTAMDRHAVAWKMRTTGGHSTGERGGKITKHGGGQGYLESDKAFTLATTHDQYISIGYPDVSPTLRVEAKGSIMSGSGDINAPPAISINGNHPQWDISIEQTHTLVTNRPEQVLWEMCHTDNPTRICPDQETSPTLVSRMGTGGNQVPLIGVRRLTPTECERLQGFPDGWTEGQSDTQRYKQLGNAVAVPVAEWIGRRILSTIKE